MTPRSYLYVPGDRPDRFEKAVASEADASIFDLEDAVRPERKVAARKETADFLAQPPDAPVWVRVNNTPELIYDDLEMAASSHATGVVIPKANLEACRNSPVAVIALIETSEGVATAAKIAACEKVVRLSLGEVDLSAELGIFPSSDARELWAIRSDVVLASALAGLEPPVGPVHTNLEDEIGLARSCHQLRRQGFGARGIIHPGQISAVHAGFAPSAEELKYAMRVLAAHEDVGGGAAMLDGRFIDPAVVRQARRVLRQEET